MLKRFPGHTYVLRFNDDRELKYIVPRVGTDRCGVFDLFPGAHPGASQTKIIGKQFPPK